MASFKKDQKFKNATINLEEGLIIEKQKESQMGYSLQKVLEEWDGVTGVSITFSKNEEIDPDVG